MNIPPELLNGAATLIGWLLVHSLWQGACIALALGCALTLLRNRSAALRHACCFVALLAMVASTAGTAWVLRPGSEAVHTSAPPLAFRELPTPTLPPFVQSQPTASEAYPLATPDNSHPSPEGPLPSPTILQRVESAVPWLAFLWFAGVALLSLRHIGGWMRVRSLRRSGTPPSAALLRTFHRLSEAFGQTASIRLLISAQAATPMLTGVLKPIVLLPARIAAGLPEAELEALIAHELAHLVRRDTWTNLAQIAIETLFFYHPAVWWIAHRARCEREHAADDLALSVCRDRRTYAGALARLAELQLPADAALAATGGNLLTRIQRIVAPPQRERVISGWNLGAPALLTAFVFAAVLASHAAEDGIITVAPGESIQAAIDKAAPGTTVRLQEGEYKERVLITKSVILEGAGAEKTRIVVEEPDAREIAAIREDLEKRYTSATTAEEKRALSAEWTTKVTRPAIAVRDAEGVTLRNLRLQGISKRGPEGGTNSVLLHYARSKGTVNDCAVVGPYDNGIHLEEGSDVSISRTLVAAFWGEGIVAFGRSRGEPAYPASRLHLADSEVRSVYHYGVQLGAGCDTSIIERCRISGTAWHGVRYDHASPTITGNTFYMHARCGIYASGTTKATVRGNLFWSNEMNGISCWMTNEDVIEENTFVGNHREAIAVLGGSKPQITRNIFVKNPIAISCGMIANRGQAMGAPVLNGNLFHENPVVFQVGAEKKPTPEGSMEVDPLFVDAGKQNFALSPESPARPMKIGAAEPLLPTVGEQTLLSEEKSILPAQTASRDYKLWSAPSSPKSSPSVEQLSAKAHKDAESWVADAFQLDDGGRREAAIEKVRTAMTSDNPDEARAGVMAFVQLAPVEFDKASFRPILRKLIASPDVATRQAATQAFAVAGAEPADLKTIFALANDPAAEVRSSLAHVIMQVTKGDLTGPEASAAILKLMDPLPRDPRDVAHALWGAKFSPAIEARVLEYSRNLSQSGPGYAFFYGALSTQANKSEAVVKRLIEILADPDVVNHAGRAAWGLRQGVAPGQRKMVADAMVKVIEARSDGHLRGEAIECLRANGDQSHIPALQALLAKPGVTGDLRKTLEQLASDLKERSGSATTN